jgi:hypothetical protein
MWFFISRLLNSSNFGKYDTLSSETCKGEHSTLKQKGIELIYVQIKMKLNGLVIVSVNTIAATEFRTSNYCHLKKNDVVHALLKLVFWCIKIVRMATISNFNTVKIITLPK